MTLSIRRLSMVMLAVVVAAALGVLASCDPGDDGSGQWRKFDTSTIR
jgi:hypothetical protein